MLVANRASTEVIDVFIDLNKATVYLSSELFPFFCMYIVLPFSHSDVRFMMRIECASNMVNAFTRTSKSLRFPLFTWKYLHFLYIVKIVLLQSENWLPCLLLSSVILSFSCFSRFTLFSFTPLFWFLCAMCTTFSSIFNFPHTRSVDHNCLERAIGNQHMRLIERLPYCIMPLPHTFIYSAFRRTFHDANWMRIQHG
jgi:hypothetical protein